MLPALLALVLSAGQLAADLQARGPRATVADLVAGGDWPRAMDSVASGAPDWIALVPQLARGVDPDSDQARSLGAALARALPRAPAEVLAVVDTRRGGVIGVQIVCGSALSAAERSEAVQAVSAVPSLPGDRARPMCLKSLTGPP